MVNLIMKYVSKSGLAGHVHVVKTMVVQTGKNRPVQNLLTGQNWSKPIYNTNAFTSYLYILISI